MAYVNLPCINLPSKVFDDILNGYPADIIKVTDINDGLQKFKSNKSRIWLYQNSGADSMILQANKIAVFYDVENMSLWKHVVAHRALETVKITNLSEITSELSGPQAFNIIIKIIKKYMSAEAIIDRLNSYTDKYDPDLKQYHFIASIRSFGAEYALQRFDNCYKYDINGAHTDALIEMFPEAKAGLLKYANRKYNKKLSEADRKNVKQAFNLAVGMLKKNGYDGAYWHIVHRTTNILLNAIEYADGDLVYANTDGFIVQNPKNLIEDQPGVYGKFKQENVTGTPVYLYQAENGYLLEYTSIKNNREQVGTVPVEVRNHFNLAENKFVKFKKQKVDTWNQDVYTYKTTIIGD